MNKIHRVVGNRVKLWCYLPNIAINIMLSTKDSNKCDLPKTVICCYLPKIAIKLLLSSTDSDKCDLLSQNEHKVATAAIWNYYRFKFFLIQALKWYKICAYSALFCPAKISILCWFSFVFYCFVTCLTGCIFANRWLYAHFVVVSHKCDATYQT